MDPETESQVPCPEVAANLSGHQDVAEYYSPPRVLPIARSKGLRGSLSCDILTGWNFRLPHLRQASVEMLSRLAIKLVILSPPCTAFLELQRLWNYKRMTRDAMERQWEEGMTYLRHSMECAAAQHAAGRHFAFEHPARASSWKTAEVSRVASLSGVQVVVFDQCTVGLTSPKSGIPMRKRTRLMTNCPVLAQRFAGRMCDRSHQHQTIQGSEGGIRRSVWAQLYPAPMVDLLAQPR